MIVDLFLVYQFIRRLATPFNKWPAYEAGVIDDKGNILKGKKDRNTKSEKDSFRIFDLMILKMKKLLGKVPGGSSRIASYAAALYLIKEWNHFSDQTLLSESITDNQLDESLDLFLSRYNHYTTLAEDVNQKMSLDEKLSADDDMSDWIDDFYKSDAPQFQGKSKAKRRQMAIAAKLSAQEEGVDESALNMRAIKLVNKIKKSGVVKTGSMSKSINTKPTIKEEPANSAGGGGIAGLDGTHMSKAAQKKWTSQNKAQSKKKRLRDIIGVKT